MSKTNNKKRSFNIAVRAIIILIITVLTVLLYPRSDIFKYSYTKGLTWTYDTLVSPIDFPIYKTKKEYQSDIKQIKENLIPIFKQDNRLYNKESARLKSSIRNLNNKSLEMLNLYIIPKITKIFDIGVLETTPFVEANKTEVIKVIYGNIAKTISFESVYTEDNATDYLKNYVDSLVSGSPELRGLNDIHIADYIVPNLIFESDKTDMELNEQLNSVSLTRGMIRRGQIVITPDELITSDKIKILDSLKKKYNTDISSDSIWNVVVGQSIIALVAIMVFTIFLYFQKKIFFNNKNFLFLNIMYLATILIASLSYLYKINIFILPILFFIIVVKILFDRRIALFLLISVTIATSVFAMDSYLYITMQLLAGIVIVYSLSQFQKRSQLFISIMSGLIIYIAVYCAFILMKGESVFTSYNISNIGYMLINSLILTLSYAAIYLMERIFGYTSEITFLELCNHSHPLLRRLIKDASGTFQHSLMVSNLAEEAVIRIGGDALLTRTGALYHDIGKLGDPIFFIENQSGGVNPHDNLEFDESAKKIISHVYKGVELANKYRLPEVITSFIKTHHGKSKVKYFYNSFKNKYPNRDINEDDFTYPGPDPISKECSVVMMADAVEAVARTLEIKTEENIRNLVSNIIDGQLKDGRFLNSEITFRDISIVKNIFTEILTNVYHSRISYPKLKEQDKKD